MLALPVLIFYQLEKLMLYIFKISGKKNLDKR